MAVLEKGDSDAKFGRRVACVVQGAEWEGLAGEGKAGGEGKDSTGELAQLSLLVSC